ncbi:IS6 family transposase [Ochrobactrum cytisi]|nr:IS6 family transposase [Brucella cytisi]
MLRARYLNNVLERGHRFIRRIMRPVMRFKVFHSASATVAGIEVPHILRSNQFANDVRLRFKIFAELTK